MKSLIVLVSLVAVSKALPASVKIVGGEQASPGEFPYMAAIIYNDRFYCGGSIIGPNKILTGASCADVGGAGSYQVRVGEHSLSQLDGTEQVIQVSKITLHPDYTWQDVGNDIAVLTLTSNIDLSSPAVGVIEMAAAADNPTGDAETIGWGSESESGSGVDILRKVTLPIVPNPVCVEAHGPDVYDSMICAGAEEGGKDSCFGDYGGPLIADIGGTTKIVGIVSWGYGCGRPGYPGVYTRVSSFRSWVDSVN
jgi:trypsin